MLAQADFRQAVEMLPLVSIDLLLRDASGRYLTGLRTNPPAQGAWFVPGGRIRKNETLRNALQRIARDELGLPIAPDAWQPRGVYEHFYGTNFSGEAGRSTHYVVLAYEADLSLDIACLPQAQHHSYRWLPAEVIAADPGVHPYTQAYFKERAP
ncbi:GDP-mannose mannosyl hydrolase [Achromobacter seleniivolatilans]|uniref:GDP-mannose mannosyl hydrolase n=1 Tax=Achromobacter seleniivolatilans TaxID=3047478 RepID=A0ABY9MAK4_9BURK|nr:GDP-mannose mannosyl hydrolase [Achromobacter sp. R39]WMD23875.1 GDP-mannose mannosyl hydrolase [Achromobacter sp. R39]